MHPLFIISVSMERNNVGGKQAGGEVCFFHALQPRAERLVTPSLLGHRKDLQSGFLWVKQFCVIPRRT